MRQVSETEKAVLRNIIRYHEHGTLSNLASLLDTWLINKEIQLNFVVGYAEVHLDMQYDIDGTIVDELNELISRVVTTIKLLEDLQRAGYVTLFLEAKPGWEGRYGQLIEGNAFVSSRIEDADVTRLLLDYSYKSILVGQPLIDYVNNGFRTAEEKNTQFEIKFAIGALLVSIVLSCIEIYYSVQEVKYSKLQTEQEQTVKINDAQLKGIENKIDDNNKAIREVNRKLQQLQTPKKQDR